MEPDEYKVKILHYLNPHLIWALVENEGERNMFRFEQLGIYGVLPLNVELDYEGNVTTSRSEEWMPAIFVAMKKLLLDAKEVVFVVTFMDKTTSIFDDNLHKFGDLKITLKNGSTISMQQRLLETGLAMEDVQYFQTSLQTKLNYVNTATVMNKIKQSLLLLNLPMKHLETALHNQCSIFDKTVLVEEKTSPRDFDVDDRNNVAALLKIHINDLNACKDVDEVSAGRASSVKNIKGMNNSGLMKKLNIIKAQSEASDVDLALHGNKEIDTNLQLNKSQDINQNEEKFKSNYQEFQAKNKVSAKKFHPKNKNKEKKYIALGPCGLNTSQYVLKEVTREIEQPMEPKKIEKTPTEVIESEFDMFENNDSDVNINIKNVANLKLKIKENIVENGEIKNIEDVNQDRNTIQNPKPGSLYRKMKILREKMAKLNDSSSTTETDSATKQGDDSDNESITALVHKLDVSSNSIKKAVRTETDVVGIMVKNNANPFKNLDSSKSVFVEKLISPSVMVHTKNGNRIQPVSNLRDVPFGTDIHIVLRNMSIKRPMRPQTVSWSTILRGHSLFLVSPADSGKTMGYLPAVCRLVSDSKKMIEGLSLTRLTCIILCATSNSVSYVEDICKMFLHDAKVFACIAGLDGLTITTSILNGCDILVCTPCLLVRLMRENLGLDLRNLTTFVIDDCERTSDVYINELKYCILKVKDMLKGRANKELKVQYIVASRIWCDFMSSLAKKAPDSVVCIGAFQECVLYSQVDTTVEFVSNEIKLDSLINFLKGIDKSKKTVIACRSDDEVKLIEKTLTNLKYIVFACDSTMTVQDLYAIDLALSEYKEPLLGPILVCCDGNLNHLNITDAHYLVHFSLPELFSMFCKRFAVLIDNYASIFDKGPSDAKIKVFIDNNNVEQLPKILNFVKRCTSNISEELEKISSSVMEEKDFAKARDFVPLCNLLLTLGKCLDLWNCRQRHALFPEFDKPSDWIPKEGTVTFKILHFHNAVHYSVRMISCVDENGVNKYPQTYSMLSIKLGMYYSREVNRKLHGIAKPGDVCAVALKHNLFARCQVIKILQYTQNNHPSVLLINLIDEEKYERVHDTCLYHLPEDLKKINTYVAKVVLSNLKPQDKDISYSKIAEDQLTKIAKNEDLYMRGLVSLAIGNCIFLDTLEACQDLSSMKETVVKNNFRNELLDGFAIENADHMKILKEKSERLGYIPKSVSKVESVVRKPIKILPEARWAHLESDTHVPVYYLYAKSPGQLFVQHVKFQDCLDGLLKDVKKYVSESPEAATDIKEGDIVLAEFPDDMAYERARIDNILEGNKVKCFFVDLGDWRIVSTNKLLSITEKIITQLPFQAIECRLVGINPLGDEWSEFSTNWLVDQCYDSKSNLKYLFAKRCTKEKADFTGGDKYGIALIDTYAGDACINKLMLDANLAEANEEIELLSSINIKQEGKRKAIKETSSDSDSVIETDLGKTQNDAKLATAKPEILVSSSKQRHTKSNNVILEPNDENQIALSDSWTEFSSTDERESMRSTNMVYASQRAAMDILRNNPLRSVPLVDIDDIDDDDKWDAPNAPLMFFSNKNTCEQVNESKIIYPEDVKKPSTSNCIAIKAAEEKTEPCANVDKDAKEANEIEQKKTVAPKTKSDDQIHKNWSVSTINANTILLHDDANNKIELNWTQNNISVTMKIQVKTDEYELIINDKELLFYTKDGYGFQFELYGVVDVDRCFHSNEDTHIEVILKKIINKKWFNLYKADIKKRLPSNEVSKGADGKKQVGTNEVANDAKIKQNNDDKITSTPEIVKSDEQNTNNVENVANKLRKPKLVWRQTKHKVTIKILVITEKYDLIIRDKHIEFHAYANDEEYGFEFDLYGVVDADKSSHANKGQYIQVNLIKILSTNWLVLSIGNLKKWIVYDVDNIDVSSEEEIDSKEADLEIFKRNLKFDQNSDSDDEFQDDTRFSYK